MLALKPTRLPGNVLYARCQGGPVAAVSVHIMDNVVIDIMDDVVIV